ncbi:2-C-methyl-D-erythritol-2,4-cyclodiphosphate synthase [[Clostridium] ultunense Esp]|nr:2-C-methyl-D-erythritol-2,4-cyclodiphosphate synthase [[Clostridium] ultunense Esp]
MGKLLRIGHGFDVHAFSPRRPLILGGVEIPHEKGLIGHSDADVLLHAIADAILGALAMGDIGKFFPDTDPAYKGADSKELLRHVWKMARERGYVLGNLDCTILAQKPRIAPYIPAMKRTIADILQGTEEEINVKATTTERLGFVGREEGIAAEAVLLLRREGT